MSDEIMRIVVGRDALPFEIENKKTGEVQEFEIREISGAQHERLLNFMNTKMDIVPSTGEVKKVKDYRGMQTHLLSMCVYRKGADKPMKEAEIAEWPPSAISQIYSAADDFNELSKKLESGEDEEGND